MFGQSPPPSNDDEDATFFDDLSLEHRIRRTLSHSPGPLRLLDSHSPVRRSPSDVSYERPHYQYQSSSASSPLHRQLGFDDHRHGPSLSPSPGGRNNNNNALVSQDNAALAVEKLQEDLRKAMNSLNWMKQQKETADARAREAQQKNEQLLQEKQLLQQRGRKSNHNRPSTTTAAASSSGRPFFGEEHFEHTITNFESGDNSNQLMRDFRAALGQIETLQAALDATRNKNPDNAHPNSHAKIPSTSPGGGPQSTGNKSPREAGRNQQTQQLEKMKLELEEAKLLLQRRDDEIFRLKEELEQTKKESGEEIERLGLALEEMRHVASRLGAGAGVSPAAAAAVQDGPTESIVDRLSRIRDAADRASLVKDHHREIMRLKSQQDSQIKAISSQNEENLQKAFNSTKLLLSTKHKEALESLQAEYDKSTAAMEQRHREEIERMKKEIVEGSNLSEELVAAAMSKIGSGKQLITREMGNTQELKEAIRQLEQRTLFEKANEKAKHAKEIESLKRGWEQQREAMLDTMKAGVNDLFSKNRIPASDNDKANVTPERKDTRSQVQEILERSFDTCIDTDQDQQAHSPYTGLDDELRETEALVRGLLRDL